MNIVPTNMTVADYCQAMGRGEHIINRKYQRSDKVWPPAARSFLIETIVLGYPMPKLSLAQVTDLKSRKTYKEIVDGQQRSAAIFDFYQDKLRLSSTLETDAIAGKTYSELDDRDKQRFIDYSLSLDLFVSATPEEVREVFRRMNSYTVPLNPEEHRHASYQGEFKWFVYRFARDYDESFLAMGLFRPQQIVRMQDTKLLTELCHALLNGIKTTNKRSLDALYRGKEKDFPERELLRDRIAGAFDQLIEWPQLHEGALMKPHLIYSLMLAMMHMRRPCDALEEVYSSPTIGSFETPVVLSNLGALAEVLQNPDEPGELADFLTASTGGTNVREKRARRFVWFCKALLPEVL